MHVDGFGNSSALIDRELSRHFGLQERSWGPGSRLANQGYPNERIYLLVSGITKLTSVDEYGRELILGLRSAGCILGAEAAVLGRPSF